MVGRGAHTHQDIALGVEQHHLLVGQRQGQAQCEGGVSAHGRVAQGQVAVGLLAYVHPETAAATRNHDGVASQLVKYFQHLGCLHHIAHILDRGPLSAHVEAVILVADQHGHRALFPGGLGESHRYTVGVFVRLH